MSSKSAFPDLKNDNYKTQSNIGEILVQIILYIFFPLKMTLNLILSLRFRLQAILSAFCSCNTTICLSLLLTVKHTLELLTNTSLF